MSKNDWDALGRQWQQQVLPPTDDGRTLKVALYQYRRSHRRRLYGEGFGVAAVVGLMVWTVLDSPRHAVMSACLVMVLLLWQCGLWRLRRHWGLARAGTGLRQMLQSDLRLARYRLVYHASGLTVGGMMLAWSWPQLPPLGDRVLVKAWLAMVVLGSLGYALWVGRQALQRIARMRDQLQRLEDDRG